MFPNRSLKSTPTRYQAQPACRGTYVHRSRPSLSLSPRASPTTTDAAAKIDLIGLITQSIGFDRSAPIRSTSHCLWIPETKSRGPSRRPPRPLLRWRWLPFFIRFAQSMLLLLVCCPTWDAGPDTRPRPSRAGGTWAPVVERVCPIRSGPCRGPVGTVRIKIRGRSTHAATENHSHSPLSLAQALGGAAMRRAHPD